MSVDPVLSNRLAHDIAGFMDGALSYADLSQKLIYRDNLEQVGWDNPRHYPRPWVRLVDAPPHPRQPEPVFRIRTGDE